MKTNLKNNPENTPVVPARGATCGVGLRAGAGRAGTGACPYVARGVEFAGAPPRGRPGVSPCAARGLEGQRGAALVIGLVMLILITIVSLSVMQGVREQEAMAGSAGRLSVAFEKAEVGLRGVENEFLYAKRSLDTGSPAECNVELAGGVCFAGQDFTTLGGWAQHKVYRIALYGDPGSPWYKVEELPAISSTASLGTNFKGSGTDTSNNMKPYRITALGSDAADPATDSSVVVLQSVVVVQ